MAELERTVGGCSDEEWRRTSEAEGWTVAAVAHHVASAQPSILQMVQAVANGQAPPPITSEMLDENNAKHAVELAACSRDEVLDLLRREGSESVEVVRSFSDEQLDRAAPMAFAGGAPMSALHLVEAGFIGHVAEHLASIKAAVGR